MTDVTNQYRDLISELGYAGSVNYVTDPEALSETAHLLRAAQGVNVRGIYFFRTDSGPAQMLAPRPAVYVAEARNEDDARKIHRLIWNQGAVPFLVVVLPHQVRVYAGFRYDPDGADALLATAPLADRSVLHEALKNYFAPRIDDGYLWSELSSVRPQDRVDTHLLRNLEALGDHLINDQDLRPEVAHALIGKYIYIRYLVDRKILSSEWLADQGIEIRSVLSRHATLEGLRRLVHALESRFKGQVFPLALEGVTAPDDRTIALVASVFAGEDLTSGQLPLDFQVYDFSYIPVELLSSIYEQFLHVEGKGADAGAYYTPEPIADYLLAEINSEYPSRAGDHKVLDPCCGSGIFLVLAYRRLIEAARSARPDRKLSPEELRELLEGSIYGVERNLEACYVTEFSLILTLLSYIDPPDLHQNDSFEFPELHNRNIFECDFFDVTSSFANSGLRFDWIVGNPPWLELTDSQVNGVILGWIAKHKKTYAIARSRASEAFLWRVTEFTKPDGMIALLVHATTLTNLHSRHFRVEFFRRNDVRRITNFSNLAYALFAGSAESPAASFVYRPVLAENSGDSGIVHYGPFAANQVLTRDHIRTRPWAITIFEDEITMISTREARRGDSLTWKVALWGTYRDTRTLARLAARLPLTLKALTKELGGSLALGLQLRNGDTPESDRLEPIEPVPVLRGKHIMNRALARRFKRRFSVNPVVLDAIDDAECYVRKGRVRGLAVLRAPHLWIDVGIAAFSDSDFVLPHPLIGLSVPREHADHLRALSIYLNSSLAHYFEFFDSSSWGVDRRRMNLNEIERLRVPRLNGEQVRTLAALHRRLGTAEAEAEQAILSLPLADPQDEIDSAVFKAVEIPEDEAVVVREFLQVRLTLDKGKTRTLATSTPGGAVLAAYARFLRDELDEYAELRHAVTILASDDLIVCEIRIISDEFDAIEPQVLTGRAAVDEYRTVWDAIRERHSQWVYVQRGLRFFDGERVVLCKAPRFIDWTCTQAMLDSDDIISEIVEQVGIG